MADDFARGEKYRRQIRDVEGRLCHVYDEFTARWAPALIDPARVVAAYDPPDAASGLPAQIVKKALMPGNRGKGDVDADLRGVVAAAEAMRAALPKPDPREDALGLPCPDESPTDA
ncbi:hypothetical protein [Alienimonas sp. DA493]|uniref:hypothetical protein n=1 Tax=Alienimonas sp. DA493 TaxID=3373605 RepID=UPI0037549CFD